LGFLGGRLLGQLSFYLIVIVVGLTALGQAGIDTSIITSQLSLAVGAILLTMGISYGFASKDILTNILSSFYGRRIFREGQIIEMENGDKGRIIEMGSLHVRLRTEEGELVIPQSQLLNGRVKIAKEKSDWD
jgi:small-conductance mechanosensitive channel